MAHFGVPDRGGRGGRFGSTFSYRPKWLSTSAPTLQHGAPDLSSNPYSNIQKQYSDGSAFIDQRQTPTNSTTNTKSNDIDSNGWKTFIGKSHQSRKKTVNKINTSVTYNELQRKSLTANISPTSTPTEDSFSLSQETHNLSKFTGKVLVMPVC